MSRVAGGVSVVMPLFNAERYLAESIRSALGQSRPPLEILVVDDGSRDGSVAIASSFGDPVRVILQANSGPAAARNRGIAEARGEHIAFLDADDLWPPGMLASHIARFAQEPGLDVVMGQIQCIAADGTMGDLRPVSDPFVGYILGCALYRAEVFSRIGPLDPAMRYGEDSDWFLRAREQGLSIRTFAEISLHYRRHPGNMTRGHTMHDLNVFKAIKMSLDRRRRETGTAGPLPPIPGCDP